MNKQEQNIAIAKACGYTQGVGLHGLEWWTNDEGVHDEPPDYVNSLNAMHEAEKVMSEMQSGQYERLLMGSRRFVGAAEFWTYHATAAQRAEAFLRTLNLWKE
jgi:hypothetical protein